MYNIKNQSVTVLIVAYFVTLGLSGCASNKSPVVTPTTYATMFSQSTAGLAISKNALLTSVTSKAGGAGTTDPATEREVNLYADGVENHCAFVEQSLTSQINGFTHKEATWNAVGELVTVIGGVTVYAPGKAILIALGISSSGGGNSIIGGLATSDENMIKVAQAQINSVQTNYQASFAKYNDIKPETDKNG